MKFQPGLGRGPNRHAAKGTRPQETRGEGARRTLDPARRLSTHPWHTPSRGMTAAELGRVWRLGSGPRLGPAGSLRFPKHNVGGRVRWCQAQRLDLRPPRGSRRAPSWRERGRGHRSPGSQRG
jgi:hypothetical protein